MCVRKTYGTKALPTYIKPSGPGQAGHARISPPNCGHVDHFCVARWARPSIEPEMILNCSSATRSRNVCVSIWVVANFFKRLLGAIRAMRGVRFRTGLNGRCRAIRLTIITRSLCRTPTKGSTYQRTNGAKNYGQRNSVGFRFNAARAVPRHWMSEVGTGRSCYVPTFRKHSTVHRCKSSRQYKPSCMI